MNALTLRRPLSLGRSIPVLANPSPPELSPELAQIVRALAPSGDIEEAWLEFDRRICAFRETPAASEYFHNYAGLVKRATGISLAQADALEEAYHAWELSFIDYAALERRESVGRLESLAGEQFCGYCGGRFKDIDEMMTHQGNCSFASKGSSLGLELWRRND